MSRHYSLTTNRRLYEVGTVLEHKHLIVRAELNNPPQCTTAIEAWMRKLVEAIDMKILMGPYSVYSDMVGNRGLTAVTIIETSHIALHVWDECEPALAQLDVYTCSALNTDDVFEAMKEWNPTQVEYKYIDREHGLTFIETKVL
jgi:S-adenosylmethionine/arginine decarboxylase-like enzyme